MLRGAVRKAVSIGEPEPVIKAGVQMCYLAQLLAISNRAAYNLCNTTKDFKVIRLGTSIRVSKQSFDDWFDAV